MDKQSAVSSASFAELLRETRQQAGLTLEGLGQISGVSARAISELERGRSTPRPKTLDRLVTALDLGLPQRALLLQAARTTQQHAPAGLPFNFPQTSASSPDMVRNWPWR